MFLKIVNSSLICLFLLLCALPGAPLSNFQSEDLEMAKLMKAKGEQETRDMILVLKKL